MKIPSFDNTKWYALVGCLAVALILLATLQYESSRRISHTTTEQMLTNLEGSLANLRQGLEAEFAPLCRELQQNESTVNGEALPEYARRFERWRRAAAHPSLVAGVYIWRPSNNRSSDLFHLDLQSSEFAPAEWPSNLSHLHQRLQGISLAESPGGHPPDLDGTRGLESGPPPSPEPPPDGAKRPEGPGQGMSGEFNPPSDYGRPNPPPDSPGRDEPPRGRFPKRAGTPAPHAPDDQTSQRWMIDENVPVLVHQVVEDAPPHFPNGTRGPNVIWVLVILDPNILRSHILPELVQRYFGPKDKRQYEVAVIKENSGDREVIYSSDPPFGQGSAAPDATLNLFGRPIPVIGKLQALIPTPAPAGSHGRQSEQRPGTAESSPGQFEAEPFKIEPILYAPGEEGWEVIARHNQGSVDAAVTSLFHRNLAFNFAVLLVLAVTIGLIAVTSRRAQRLAQLQLDFVTSVSHELRTPLTGIVSAAQNIADGVVDGKIRVTRYGTAILNQAQQLSELIEQILLFSATEKGLHRYHLEAVRIEDLIEVSLANTSALIRSAGVTVEKQIQPNLPPVMIDFKAFAHCLQNLIANAVKYGGDRRWVGIKVSAQQFREHGREIQIAVEDRGIGIEKDDLERVFEPFYRSPVATAAQIHGNGLGLPLVKTITEAMGGRLTVESVSNKGSTFTVHLPVVNHEEKD
jgi:signal transduction histidine kinase